MKWGIFLMKIVSGNTLAFSTARKGARGKNNKTSGLEILKSHDPLLDASVEDTALILQAQLIDKHLRKQITHLNIKPMVIWGKKTFLRGYYWAKKKKIPAKELIMCGRLSYIRLTGKDLPLYKRTSEELPSIVDGANHSLIFVFEKERSLRPLRLQNAPIAVSDVAGKEISFAFQVRMENRKESGQKKGNQKTAPKFITIDFDAVDSINAHLPVDGVKLESHNSLQKIAIWISVPTAGVQKEDEVEGEDNHQRNIFGFVKWQSPIYTQFEGLEVSQEHPVFVQEFSNNGPSSFSIFVKPISIGPSSEEMEAPHGSHHTQANFIQILVSRISSKIAKILNPKIFFNDNSVARMVNIKIMAINTPEDEDRGKDNKVDLSLLISTDGRVSNQDFVN